MDKVRVLSEYDKQVHKKNVEVMDEEQEDKKWSGREQVVGEHEQSGHVLFYQS